MTPSLLTNVHSDVRIGVVGPPDAVDRIIMAAESSGRRLHLVGSSPDSAEHTSDALGRIDDQIDVVLFAGRMQLDLAHRAGPIKVPATFVPVSGSELYFPLMRAALSRDFDPERVSVDSINPDEVQEAYREVGLSSEHVYTREYTDPQSAQGFAAFHRDLFRAGRTTAAVTGLVAVAEQLRSEDVPVVRTLPTLATLRASVRDAALLGAGNRLESAQTAIAIVEIDRTRRARHAGPGNYEQQRLKLVLHHSLLEYASRVGAIVLPRDESSYTVLTTLAALSAATGGVRAAPFPRILGPTDTPVEIQVGIGFGRTPRDAENNALRAVDEAHRDPRAGAVLITADDDVVVLPDPGQAAAPPSAPKSRNAQIVDQLAAGLALRGEETLRIDSTQVGQILNVSSPTARRILSNLAADGLAWALGPRKNGDGGRPRQTFRLVPTASAKRTTGRDAEPASISLP